MTLAMTAIPGSSSIAAAGWDPDTGVLEIQFTSGKTYTYQDVPQEIYDGLMSADSAGQYFHSSIKGVYA